MSRPQAWNETEDQRRQNAQPDGEEQHVAVHADSVAGKVVGRGEVGCAERKKGCQFSPPEGEQQTETAAHASQHQVLDQ